MKHKNQQELVTEALKRKGMSWYALSKATGIRETMLGKFRKDGFQFRKPEIIHPIAQALDLNPDEIYLAGNHVPTDVQQALIRHPELLTVVRNLATKLDG